MAPATVSLGDDASLHTIESIARRMEDALGGQRELRIDLGQPQQADLSVLQLIESTRRHCAAVGCDLSLAAPAPPMVRDLLDRAGFTAGFTPADINFWFHGDYPQ